MQRILKKLSCSQGDYIIVFCDNSSAIKLSKNPILHDCSKYIDVCFHFLRDLTKEGTLEFKYCGTKDQIVDIMTKSLKFDMFQKMRAMLGVCEEPVVN